MPYNSQERVYEEEDEVEGDHEEYGELSLHQLAQQAELEEERLPDQEKEPEDEAEIIHNYGLYAQYDEKEKRYTVKYDRKTQDVIRSAIKDTARGIEKVLLPEK